MKAHESRWTLEQQITRSGLTLERLQVHEGFAFMFEFYRLQRADGCPPENDGDMLLYQWGTYGRDECFELDLTRQFIIGDAEDENIWQLSLTFKFASTDKLLTLGSGSKWCHEIWPRAVDDFEQFVRESEAYRAVAGLRPLKSELDYFNAG
jgi:hypothetical protein